MLSESSFFKHPAESNVEFAECNVCGQSHNTERCPFLSETYKVEDAPTPSLARLTLPSNLVVKDLANGTTTVVAQAKFPRGTRFGPFQAAITVILPTEVAFPLKVFGKDDDDSFYLDTRDENQCNWMCLVAPVSSASDKQNLICYQLQKSIYFSASEDVEPGDELKVWYAPFYGLKMGFTPGKFDEPASPPEPEISPEDIYEQQVISEADTTTASGEPLQEETVSCSAKRKTRWHPEKEKKKKKVYPNQIDKAVTAYVAQQLPPEQLGAKFKPPCWRCRECGAMEESVILYARHLMDHIKPPEPAVSNRPLCKVCSKTFPNKKALKRHHHKNHSSFVNRQSVKRPEDRIDNCLNPDDPDDPDDPMPLEGNQNSFSSELVQIQPSSAAAATSMNMTIVCDDQTLIGNSDKDIAALQEVNSLVPSVNCSVSSQQQNIVLCKENFPEVTLNEHSTLVESKNSDNLSNVNWQLKTVGSVPPSPATTLNHEFFTRVAGDMMLQDVKSLLSKGYSLQFLVEHEDGSTALVDVLPTPESNNVSSTSASFPQEQEQQLQQEQQQQQLVVTSSGNIRANLPLALQGILPSSVPYASNVMDSSSSFSHVIQASPDCSSASMNTQLGTMNDTNAILEPPIASGMETRSPPPCVLSSASSQRMSYDDVLPFRSTACNDPDKEFCLEGSGTYGLSSLSLPLTVEDSSSSEYLTPCPSQSAKHDSMTSSISAAICSSMKLLEPCFSSELREDIMGFGFEDANGILSSPQPSDKECSEGLTKDFSDLIAADAENSSIVLAINPPEEEMKTCSEAYSKDEKGEKGGLPEGLQWMGSGGLSLSTHPLSEKLPEVNSSGATAAYGPTSLGPYGDLTLPGNDDAGLTPELDGILLGTSAAVLPEPSTESSTAISSVAESQPDTTRINPPATPEEEAEIRVERSRISDGPPFTCDICNRTLSCAMYLYRHLRKHTGEFTCVTCRLAFARKENLQLHSCSGRRTGDRKKSNSHLGKFTCPYCPRRFPARRHLTHHLNVHLGVKKYHCNNCGKAFAKRKEYYLHLDDCSVRLPKPVSRSLGTSRLERQQNLLQNRNPQVEQPGQSETGENLTCATCHHIFLSVDALCIHERKSKHVVQPAASCDHCGRSLALATPERTANHLSLCAPARALQSGESSVVLCPVCNAPFRELILYRQHVFRHTHPHVCPHCRMAFSTLEIRGRHVCMDHWEECLQCKKHFSSVLQLEKHALSHGVPAHHCFECGRSFHKQEDFILHRCFELNTKFRKKKTTVAGSGSPAASSDMSASSTTDKKDETSSDSVVCEVCGETFKRSSIRKHSVSHLEKKFECSVCHKRFHRRDVLTEHMYVHQDAQIPCLLCNKLLKSQKSLYVHMKQHSEDKKFICQVCGKSFRLKVNLQQHEERHHNPKRTLQHCPHCSRSFQTTENLSNHILEHHEGLRFQCTQCNRSFVKENLLQKHVRLYHSGGSYCCPVCGHVVKQRTSLRRHLLKHHPEMASATATAARSSATAASSSATAASSSASVISSSATAIRSYISAMDSSVTAISSSIAPVDANSASAQTALIMNGGELLPPTSPEVLLTVSQLQLTTDGMQHLSFATDATVEGAECLLEGGSYIPPEDMVLYVLQQPSLPSPTLQEPPVLDCDMSQR